MKVQTFSNKTVIPNTLKSSKNQTFTASGEIKVVSGNLVIPEEKKAAFDTLFSQYGTDKDTVKILVSHKPSVAGNPSSIAAVVKTTFDGVSGSARFALTYLESGKSMTKQINPLDMLYGLMHTILDLKVAK